MADAPITPTVTALIRGQRLEVSEVVINNTVNSLATVQVSGHSTADAKATSESAEIPAGRLAADAGELQRYILTTARLAPDMQVELNDGVYGKVTFSGYVASPAFSTQSDSVQMTYAGVHAASVLDFYTANVFELVGRGPNNTGEGWLDPQQSALKNLRSNSVAEVLGTMLTVYTKNLEEGKAGSVYGDATRRAMITAMLSRNKVVASYVYRFLVDSVATTKIPNVTFHGSDSAGIYIRSHLSHLICQPGGFRSVVVNSMLEEYGMQFVCYLNGQQPGARLENITYANAIPSVLSVKSENFMFTAGGSAELPIKGVVIRGIAHKEALTGSQSQSGTAGIPEALAIYPGNAKFTPGARFVELEPPSWYSMRMMVSRDTQHVAGTIANFRGKYPRAQQLLKENNSVTVKLLNWWARMKFAYHSLLSSRATLNGPLDSRIQAGRTYAIRVAADGGGASQLFTGYAVSVTHRVSTQGALAASTSVEFSHVQAQGYTQAGERPGL
jgi:hypothetical protein